MNVKINPSFVGVHFELTKIAAWQPAGTGRDQVACFHLPISSGSLPDGPWWVGVLELCSPDKLLVSDLADIT